MATALTLHNNTSFATHVLGATSSILDALAQTGSRRKLELELAEVKVKAALAATALDEEKVLPAQLLAILRLFEVRGWDV